MARVTVEDCLANVKNRFELVIIAAKRARQLMRGSYEPKVAWENDKPTVVALREIAMGYTDVSDNPHLDEINPDFLADKSSASMLMESNTSLETTSDESSTPAQTEASENDQTPSENSENNPQPE